MQTQWLCELVRYRPAKRQDERLVVEDMEERKAVLHAVLHKMECEHRQAYAFGVRLAPRQIAVDLQHAVRRLT